MAQFKVGDVVQLKSGGPKMTVKNVYESDNTYSCQWFTGSKLADGHFPQDSLIRIADDERK